MKDPHQIIPIIFFRRSPRTLVGFAATLTLVLGALPLGAQTNEPPDARLLRARERCASGDSAGGRAEYARLTEDTNAPVALRSLAQLSLAQSWRRERNWQAAEAAYARVVALEGAPAHHRDEAEEQIRGLAQLRAKKPAREGDTRHAAIPSWPKPGLRLHVAPHGSDTHPGTAARPLATLEGARDAIRRLRQHGNLPAGGVAVMVHGGHYSVRRTFSLGAEDSGTAEAPIVYRAADGESPVFSGGLRIGGFTPLRDTARLERLPEAARGRVVQADLEALGVSHVPPVRLGGFASGAGFGSHPALELFFNGEAMPLSRWPNDGFVRVVEANAAPPGSPGGKTGVFTYEGDRPARWQGDPDILLYGYWFYGWADSYERVASIDLERKAITLAPPFHTYGYRRGQPYRAVNLFSEIDEAGEWYLDRRSRMLYFYPPSDPARAVVEVSLLESPMVELKEVCHVAFQGLTWELGCTDGLRVTGGGHCLLAGCTVRRCGGNAVEVAGGAGHRAVACDLYSLGRGGFVIAGGDRKTLAPARHLVENCHVRDLSRLDRTYTPAVLLDGVGNRVAHNLFHDIRSSALRVEGNNHLIEFNEIARVVLESDDQGGVDMFGNPTYRGNVYRFNYFHHVGHWRHPAQEPECGQAGIRLDDMISGTLIYGNIFFHCGAGRLGFGGVQIHGGKENIVDNNLFIDCPTAVSFSPWGENTWRERAGRALDSPAIDRALYLSRYPTLARLKEDLNVNHLWRNLVVNSGEFLRRGHPSARLLGNCVVTNQHWFPEAARGLFRLKGDEPWLAGTGFQPLPFEEIGLYRDALRRKLPVRELAELRAGR